MNKNPLLATFVSSLIKVNKKQYTSCTNRRTTQPTVWLIVRVLRRALHSLLHTHAHTPPASNIKGGSCAGGKGCAGCSRDVYCILLLLPCAHTHTHPHTRTHTDVYKRNISAPYSISCNYGGKSISQVRYCGGVHTLCDLHTPSRMYVYVGGYVIHGNCIYGVTWVINSSVSLENHNACSLVYYWLVSWKGESKGGGDIMQNAARVISTWCSPRLSAQMSALWLMTVITICQ